MLTFKLNRERDAPLRHDRDPTGRGGKQLGQVRRGTSPDDDVVRPLTERYRHAYHVAGLSGPARGARLGTGEPVLRAATVSTRSATSSAARPSTSTT